MGISFLMKLTGCVLVVAGTSGCGIWLAGCYRQRLLELEQLRQMVFLLKGQILYANAPLHEAFEMVGKRTGGGLSELFLHVAERTEKQEGDTFRQIWNEEIERIPEGASAFGKGDRQLLSALGEYLGFLDRETQERNLLLYLEQLDLRIGEMRDRRQERCRLYTSLGVMSGLFLAVLLI